MSDALRTFIVRTILQDEAGRGLDELLTKTTALASKAFTLTLKVATADAEKSLKSIAGSAQKAIDINTTKPAKAFKEQTTAVNGLAGSLKNLEGYTNKTSQSLSGVFQRLQAGKLIVAGAAAGMVAYARSAFEVAETSRLSADMIRDQLGAQAEGLLSFAAAGEGGAGVGTSASKRMAMGQYLTMTGYGGEQAEKLTSNTERIMSSTWGQSLAGFGVQDGKDLISKLSSGDLSETSDLGRVIKDMVPAFFSQAARGTERGKVATEFQKQGKINVTQDVINAQAERNLMDRAIEQIAGQVEPDTDGFRMGMATLIGQIEDLSKKIGDAVRPAAIIILNLTNTFVKMVSVAPEIPALIAVVLGVGTAMATLGAILPYVRTGIVGITKSLAANPFGLAITVIMGLAVLFVSLEKRFQVFSKAWDYFAKSEIGGDLIAGVKSLLGMFGALGESGNIDFMGGLGKAIEWISDKAAALWDQIDSIYKMAKGGDIAGALKGGLSMLVKLTPIGMVAGFVEALGPSKRVQDLILYVLQKMKDLWDGFTRWLGDIWGVVAKFLSPLIKMFEYLRDIKDKIFGKELTGAELKTAFTEAMKASQIGTRYEQAPAQAKDLLWKLSSSELTGKDAAAAKQKVTDETGWKWSDVEIEEGKKQYDKLKSPSVIPKAETPAAIKAADDKIAVDSKETEQKLQTAMEDHNFLGYMGEAYGLGARTIYNAGEGIYNWATGNTPQEAEGAQAPPGYEGSAKGGEVTRTGWELVHEGEPIVPASVARSSNLIDSLKSIASGEPAVQQITQSVESGPKSSISSLIGQLIVNVADKDPQNIATQVKEALESQLSDFEFKHRAEQCMNRANRAFIA